MGPIVECGFCSAWSKETMCESTAFLEKKCLWLKYPLWFRKKPQDLNSHPQVAIQAHKKRCNVITESWISGVPNNTRFGLN